MHNIGNEKEQELLKQLRNEGHTIYSISRINTFNQCQFEYYNTYVNKNRGLGNCYSEVGSFTHDTIEKAYRNEIDIDNFDFAQKLHDKVFELEIMDIDFPSESIKTSFINDMSHFAKTFKKLEGEFTLEKMFITKIGDKYLMGFIDALREHGENQTDIIDWKTSSKFTGSKLIHAGRQLIVYKLGLEETSGIKIDKVMWNMLKYIYICHVQKNGNVKRKMVNRGKLIKEMYDSFQKELLSDGLDEIEVIMTLDKALETNDFHSLPTSITDKYWLEDCLLEYDVTEDKIEEVKEYILNTIAEIEDKDTSNIDEWKPLNLKKDSFYCNTLCSHREICPFLKEYNKKSKFKSLF